MVRTNFVLGQGGLVSVIDELDILNMRIVKFTQTETQTFETRSNISYTHTYNRYERDHPSISKEPLSLKSSCRKNAEKRDMRGNKGNPARILE